MRKILKKFGVGILALSLVFTPEVNISAHGKGSGSNPPSVDGNGGVPKGCGYSLGYCFRVIIIDYIRTI